MNFIKSVFTLALCAMVSFSCQSGDSKKAADTPMKVEGSVVLPDGTRIPIGEYTASWEAKDSVPVLMNVASLGWTPTDGLQVMKDPMWFKTLGDSTRVWSAGEPDVQGVTFKVVGQPDPAKIKFRVMLDKGIASELRKEWFGWDEYEGVVQYTIDDGRTWASATRVAKK